MDMENFIIQNKNLLSKIKNRFNFESIFFDFTRESLIKIFQTVNTI